MRYALILSYDGSDFHGWQIQPNAITVQSTLEHAVSTLLRSNIALTGAGRTDTGVHARYFVAHFDTDTPIDNSQNLLFRLNRFLPPSIAVQKLITVSDDFHARFSAVSRTYKYLLHQTKNPFLFKRSLFFLSDIDFNKTNESASILFDFEDFTSFSKLHTDTHTNLCKVTHAQWTQTADGWMFTIKANRFLRNMVRAIVGSLLDVGTGKTDCNKFRQILEARNRSSAGMSVPAYALYLTEIDYPEQFGIPK